MFIMLADLMCKCICNNVWMTATEVIRG